MRGLCIEAGGQRPGIEAGGLVPPAFTLAGMFTKLINILNIIKIKMIIIIVRYFDWSPVEAGGLAPRGRGRGGIKAGEKAGGLCIGGLEALAGPIAGPLEAGERPGGKAGELKLSKCRINAKNQNVKNRVNAKNNRGKCRISIE